MSSTEQIATTETAPTSKPRKKRPIGFYISGTWVSIVLFLAVFGDFLPGPQWDESFYDSLGVAPFHKSHILGTTLDGYDMYSGLVHGARLSVFVALVAVIVGGAIGTVIGVSSAYFRGKIDILITMAFNIMLSIPNLVLSLALI